MAQVENNLKSFKLAPVMQKYGWKGAQPFHHLSADGKVPSCQQAAARSDTKGGKIVPGDCEV